MDTDHAAASHNNNNNTKNTNNNDNNEQSQEQAKQSEAKLQEMLQSKIAALEVGNSKEEEEERKLAKAIQKHIKEMKQAVEGLPPGEERVKFILLKYDKLYHDVRRHERDLQAAKRRADQAIKDRDAAVGEQQRSTAVKGKLETLCRELQRQNKQVLDDAKRQAQDEHTKRQELSAKFHSTIKDVTDKMEEQAEDRIRQFKESEMLRENLQNLKEQYQIREQHYATQMKAKDLERQLLEAKLKQQADIALQEALRAQAYKEQIASMVKTEGELRNQLSLYAEKFEQFQDTLTKSNDVFTTFKQEMERMTKTIKQREKENGILKKKSEQSDVTLIELVEERNSLRKQLDTVKGQKLKLEGLCRALQAERAPSSSSLPLPTSTSPTSTLDSVDSNPTQPVSADSSDDLNPTPPVASGDTKA